jgi:hypothetical protein
MDALVIGSFLLEKAGQPPVEDDGSWRTEFELD